MTSAIKTEEQYRTALARIGQLLDANPEKESDAGHELEELVLEVMVYEREQGWNE